MRICLGKRSFASSIVSWRSSEATTTSHMRGRPCTCNSQTEEESEGEKIDRRTRGQPLLSLSLLVINDWETKTEGAPSPATNKLEKCPPFVRLPKTPPTPRSRRRRLVTPRRASEAPNLARCCCKHRSPRKGRASVEAGHTSSQFTSSLGAIHLLR